MSGEEQGLDEAQAWECITASWPVEVQEADRLLSRLEGEMEDLLEVAIQQTIARCRRYAVENGYPFTTFQLNKGLIFFNRAVEEMLAYEIEPQERSDFRTSMTEKFLGFMDDVFMSMRTEEQRQKLREGANGSRFPGDIIGMTLIQQSLAVMARYLAIGAKVKKLDYLANHRGALLELLNKHVTRLNLGKEVC